MGEVVNVSGRPRHVPNPDYGKKGEQQLVVLGPGEKVKLDGRQLEIAAGTPGVVDVNSRQGKAYLDGDERRAAPSVPGDKAYPVTDSDDLAEPSGLHITGNDAGLPVASDEEPGPHRDGSGEDDDQKGVASVIKGDVKRGDTPLGVKDDGMTILDEARKDERAQTSGPTEADALADKGSADTGSGPVKKRTVPQLKALAAERGVTVTGKGGKKPVKADYVKALKS